MKLLGRQLIEGADVAGEAFVVDFPFSFIGDFDIETGALLVENHPLFGQSMAGRILVCPEGRGGTMGPFATYEAKKKGTAPAAILCNKIDPVILEGAIASDIPMLAQFDRDIVEALKTGQWISVKGREVDVDA